MIPQYKEDKVLFVGLLIFFYTIDTWSNISLAKQRLLSIWKRKENVTREKIPDTLYYENTDWYYGITFHDFYKYDINHSNFWLRESKSYSKYKNKIYAKWTVPISWEESINVLKILKDILYLIHTLGVNKSYTFFGHAHLLMSHNKTMETHKTNRNKWFPRSAVDKTLSYLRCDPDSIPMTDSCMWKGCRPSITWVLSGHPGFLLHRY